MRFFYTVLFSSILFSCSTSDVPPQEEQSTDSTAESSEAPEKPKSDPDFSMILGDWKVEGEPMY